MSLAVTCDGSHFPPLLSLTCALWRGQIFFFVPFWVFWPHEFLMKKITAHGRMSICQLPQVIVTERAAVHLRGCRSETPCTSLPRGIDIDILASTKDQPVQARIANLSSEWVSLSSWSSSVTICCVQVDVTALMVRKDKYLSSAKTFRAPLFFSFLFFCLAKIPWGSDVYLWWDVYLDLL